MCRRRFPSRIAAAAVEGDDASSVFSQKNTEQLDHLLAGLSELRMKQQQGLMKDAADEGECDEFGEGEEGIGMLWVAYPIESDSRALCVRILASANSC